jgi:hypothetical protein
MRRAILSAIVMTLFAPPAAFSADDHLEYRVKAAFLFNFLKFVEWPSGSAQSPLVIGVLGHDPFGDVLDQTVRGKMVNGRSIEIRRYYRIADVKDCNILFLARSESDHRTVPVQPGLLTVGESPGFLKAGGIINFYREDNHVHFEIQSSIAHSAGLRVSSQLLKLGKNL